MQLQNVVNESEVESLKINGITSVEVEVTEEQIARALLHIAFERSGKPDDAGCEWTTNEKGYTCIAHDPEWVVSCDERIGTLVDAANILIHGMPLKTASVPGDLK